MDWVWVEFGLVFLNMAAFKGGKLLRVVGMASKGKRRRVFISMCIFKYLEKNFTTVRLLDWSLSLEAFHCTSV